jgi:hypothetical protein
MSRALSKAERTLKAVPAGSQSNRDRNVALTIRLELLPKPCNAFAPWREIT